MSQEQLWDSLDIHFKIKKHNELILYNYIVKYLRKRLSKSLFFRLHAWAGIIFGPFLYVICLSGSFAVISNEIDWLFNPKIRSQSGKMNWDLVFNKFNVFLLLI